ncbi:hypothetical protein L1987_03377 [Smallanthus sonchifolius]|uniref:Uncharacterized protein n=1 Tax=Smallanthus sonchifolius TaxID=185202 RepID=A0ACB9KAJ0_9ASTR|nr:hypothetical protein L1987_03377 [Smallanthus sonchifolius]
MREGQTDYVEYSSVSRRKSHQDISPEKALENRRDEMKHTINNIWLQWGFQSQKEESEQQEASRRLLLGWWIVIKVIIGGSYLRLLSVTVLVAFQSYLFNKFHHNVHSSFPYEHGS